MTCLLPARGRSALVSLVMLAAAGCARPADKPAATAAAEKPKAEADLARTTLSREAAASLGVRSEPVGTRKVQEHVPLTGWVMARQGHEVTVTAPVAGYVRAAGGAGAELPAAGLPVAAGRELFLLEPVLSAVEQIQMAALKRGVENELAKADESVKVAQSEVGRVRDLKRQGLRGQQDVEQAEARLVQAKEDLAAARDKRKLFGDADGKALDRLPPVPVTAPRAGTVLSVAVSPGQYVPAAAPLVTVIDLARPWLRVPVPEADLPRVDRREPATVVLKNGGPGGRGDALLEAKPVAAVPQVDTARHTADLIYELPAALPGAAVAAADGSASGGHAPAFAKDQMLTVLVPLGQSAEECVVPYSAVVFDAYAGAWVYVDRTPAGEAPTHSYERRRVELGPRAGEGVVIRPAGEPGERVVVAGAAAIYSREFHKPPSK